MSEHQPYEYQPDEVIVPEAHAEETSEEKDTTDSEIEKQLSAHDLRVIRSMQTQWGTIMAGPSAKESDPYNRVWIRDNTLVAISLETAGERELTTEITEGLLSLVEQHKGRIIQVIKEGKPYAVERDALHLHPAYKVNGQELDVEWGWRQNDAIGNLLQAAGILGLVEDHREIVDLLVKYLEVARYWEKDNGIWEWTQQVQVNTILSCTAGLRAVSDYVEVPEGLIKTGYETTSRLEGHSDTRYFDLAHLNPFMLGELAEPRIIEEIEHELLRDYGVIRYHDDHYMSGGKNREAQWVLGLLMLGHAWLACNNPEKARAYLEQVDSLRVNGDIPEAYIYKDGKYVAGEHTPLVWCHALALSLRHQLDELK